MKSILIKHSKLKKKKYQRYGSSNNKGAPGGKMGLNLVFKETKRVSEL